MITKPMRGSAVEEDEGHFHKLKFPLLASPKLDGIRCVKKGRALSKTFKDIPNKFVQSKLASLPDGLDGELILKKSNFNDVQSGIMSREGQPDFEFWVFDYVKTSLNTPFRDRLNDLNSLSLPDFCVKTPYVELKNLDELFAYEKQCLDAGYEGIMLRDPVGAYKCGQSSFKQGLLLKVKRFKDSECVVIGFEELMNNMNEQQEDAFGNSKRSSHKENMVPANTLGKFLVREIGNTPWKGKEFAIGTGEGLTQDLRKKIWDSKQEYLGKIITYKYQNHGIKDLPRIPIWKGFRDPLDLSEEE